MTQRERDIDVHLRRRRRHVSLSSRAAVKFPFCLFLSSSLHRGNPPPRQLRSRFPPPHAPAREHPGLLQRYHPQVKHLNLSSLKLFNMIKLTRNLGQMMTSVGLFWSKKMEERTVLPPQSLSTARATVTLVSPLARWMTATPSNLLV